MNDRDRVSLKEYNELVTIKAKYEAIINLVFSNADLNYNKTDLNIFDGDLDILIKSFEPVKWSNKLRELQRIDNKEEE